MKEKTFRGEIRKHESYCGVLRKEIIAARGSRGVHKLDMGGKAAQK